MEKYIPCMFLFLLSALAFYVAREFKAEERLRNDVDLSSLVIRAYVLSSVFIIWAVAYFFHIFLPLWLQGKNPW